MFLSFILLLMYICYILSTWFCSRRVKYLSNTLIMALKYPIWEDNRTLTPNSSTNLVTTCYKIIFWHGNRINVFALIFIHYPSCLRKTKWNLSSASFFLRFFLHVFPNEWKNIEYNFIMFKDYVVYGTR